MAIYHLTAKTGSRSGGQSAKAKADYIQREGKYARDADEVLHTQSGHMPEWASVAADYWDAADTYERANGRLFKEVEFSLPRELTLEQQTELADSFARALTDGEKLPYTLAIHAGEGSNPHCHLMMSERKNDGIEREPKQWFKRANKKQPERGGAVKSTALKPKEWLTDTREAWQAQANRALERAGHEARIDHRSHEARGIEQVPSVHIGPNVAAMEAKGIKTGRGEAAAQVKQTNARIIDLQAERERRQAQADRRAAVAEIPAAELVSRWKHDVQARAENYRSRADAVTGRLQRQADAIKGQRSESLAAHDANQPRQPRGVMVLFGGRKRYQEKLATWQAERAGIQGWQQERQATLENRLNRSATIKAQAYPRAEARMQREQPETAERIPEAEREIKAEKGRERAARSFATLAKAREKGIGAFRDGGKQWRATPPALRELIDDYNKQPQAVRQRILHKMVKQPEAGERIRELVNVSQQSRSRERGGMER